MKKAMGGLILVTLLLFAVSTIAADKVVVIPLGGSKHYMYWQGAWEVDTTYKVGDAVHTDGSSYMCIGEHTSTVGNSPPDTSYWAIIAAKGEDGAVGGLPPGQSCTPPDVMIGIDSSGNILCKDLQPKIVFVSSAKYNGNLGGLAGADAKCQQLASAAGLSGDFKAWLSDPTGSPKTRFNKYNTVFYTLVDGTVVATDWSDLTEGTIQNAIFKTEYGDGVVDNVWTDTAVGGYMAGSDHCDSWTDATSSYIGHIGAAIGNTAPNYWTYITATPHTCDNECRIYCFEQ